MARPSISIESCSWIDFISVAYARYDTTEGVAELTQFCTSLEPPDSYRTLVGQVCGRSLETPTAHL